MDSRKWATYVETVDDTYRFESTKKLGLGYSALGLAGESAELLSLFLPEVSHLGFDDAYSELGDVCWYVAAVLEDVSNINGDLVPELASPSPFSLADTYYWGVQPTSDEERRSLVAGIVVRAGSIAEQAKKILRSPEQTHEERARRALQIFQYARDILENAQCLALTLESTLADILDFNLEKLSARKSNDTLHVNEDVPEEQRV